MNLTLFIPELSLVAVAILVIILDLFTRQKALLGAVSLAGLVVAGGVQGQQAEAQRHRMLHVAPRHWSVREHLR